MVLLNWSVFKGKILGENDYFEVFVIFSMCFLSSGVLMSSCLYCFDFYL